MGGLLLFLISSRLQHSGDVPVNHALDLGIHYAGNTAPNPAIYIDGAAGAVADLRNFDVEAGLFHDLVSHVQDLGQDKHD